MEATLRILAKKFKATKFVSIRSDAAIRGYPDSNLPTLLIYKAGDIAKQFIGLSQLGGEGMTPDGICFFLVFLTHLLDLEWALANIGVIESELEEDPRAKKISLQRVNKSGYDPWSSDEDDE